LAKGKHFCASNLGQFPMFGKKLAMGKVAPSTTEKTKKTLSAHPTSLK